MMQESNLTFYGLGIAPQVLEVLAHLKFEAPTPIQYRAIPLALEGKDVIGIAQTGTGKTMAFAIPMVQRLNHQKGRGLVLVPTRELAVQVHESVEKVARPFKMRSVVLMGGDSMQRQIRELQKNPRVIIATPGRFGDLLRQRKVRLSEVSVVVLDEADRMLDMGFAPEIIKILDGIPKQRQVMLFSATMPDTILRLASQYMTMPLQVEVAPSGTTAEKVTHELFIVRRENKQKLLAELLKQYMGSVLLFCRTKIRTSRTTRYLREQGFRCAEIHSDRSLRERRQALEGFKSGKYRVLAATDIAARGIDVAGIELVINFDLPDDTENYVHRIGRTGRSGHAGHAISFAAPEERNDVHNIEKLIKQALPVSRHPEVTSEEFSKPRTMYSFRSGRSRARPRPRRRC